MPDRWSSWWRARVPEPVRSRAFDPSLADLEGDWHRASPHRGRTAIRRRLAVARLALECRRLAQRERHAGLARSAGLSLMERALMSWQDFRLGFRRLVRQPAFSVTSVITLALGIGANLAVAAYVQSFLLAPVNASSPEELIRVVQSSTQGASTEVVSWPLFLETRDGVTGVDLAAFATTTAQVGAADAAETRTAALVSGNYFRMLRLAPQAGRLIGEQDNVAELAQPVVVVSDDYWRAHLDADPAAIGRTLRINGAAFEIIGIAPAGFRGDLQTRSVDLWTPVMMQQVVRPRGLTVDRRGWGWLRLLGRRDSDLTLEQAARQFDTVAADVNRRFPPADEGSALVFRVTPAAALAEGERALLAPVLAATLAFTGLLFLVTCANLAGVMQSRLMARRRELAIRQSLGAGRGRLIAEWLAECVALALAGGGVGLLAARALVAGLGAIRPPEQLVGDLSFAAVFDWRLAAVAVGLSLLAALVFGVLPAWRAGRRVPVTWLRDASSIVTSGRSAVRLRRVAVVAQLAVAGVLLISATLLGRSLWNQQAYDTGFDTAHLGLLSVDLGRRRVPESDYGRLAADFVALMRRDPEVVAADVALSVPLGFGSDSMGVRIPGYEPPGDRDYVPIDFNVVGAGYFDALGVAFVGGSTWPATITGSQPPPVVINETMARRFWEGRNPIGEPIEVVGVATAHVVGVVRDVAYYEVGESPMPYMYVPAELQPLGSFVAHVRTAGAPEPVIARLAKALPSVDSRLAAHDVMTFEELRRIPLFPVRLLAASASVFGGLAVLLACIGLYGVVTMSVGQRTREIGVRMALGAQPQTVLSGVLREALVLAAAGLVLALVAGQAARGALQGWLFQMPRFDVVTASTVAAVIVLLALIASWIPARRAARIDPVVALRES